MKKRALTLIVVSFAIVACQDSNLEPGVACAEVQGSTELRHLGPDELEEGFPYIMRVYLPPCYAIETERAYPILFLFPGRNGGSSTWFSVGVDELADQMIISGEIPPLIIVGLPNIQGDLKAGNFAENIYPYIEHNYRILEDSRYHAIGGGSMGGAPSYRLAFQYPGRFGSAALFGSGIILSEEEQVREWLAEIPEEQLPRVFLNTGYQDELLIPRARELAAILTEFGVEIYAIYSDGGHNYEYWVSNFPEYLRWLAKGWD